MGNTLGLWSGPSPEEQVIQNHHNDLQEAIIHPLTIASKLHQEGAVSRALVSEVNTQGRSQLQNSTAIITAVTASIHSNPDQFQVFMSVLEDSPESANLASKMRTELRTLKPAPGPIERLTEKKRWYTVSAEYKRDFIRLQGSFARMFDNMCETVGSQVPVDDLKRYLCRYFREFQILLQDAVTTDDVMEAVRNESSLTDFAYFEEISDHFNLQQVKHSIRTYHSILDSFCNHKLNNHSYVRSFREDYPRYILSNDRIEFRLQWKANNYTLKDIRDVLVMSFKKEADRVQIVVIGDGSVVVVCCAPRYLMEELVRLASESVHRLAEMGVVKLTVGGTEVTIKKDSSSSFKLRKEMTQLPKPLTMTQDYFSLEEETQIPLDIDINTPEKLITSSQSPRLLPPRYITSSQSPRHITSSQSPRHITSSQSPRVISQSPRVITSSQSSSPSYETDLILSPGSRYETKKAKAITYFTRLSYPKGMVISQEGHLIVTGWSEYRITIINTDSGEVINKFGKYGLEQGEFNGPEGVALTQDGHIIVADTFNNRLQVLTIEGGFVAAVGSEGSKPLQFNQPYDVAVHHNGKIFVTENLSHRVQVLNPDLSYSHCFCSKGDKPGELNHPHGIAIDQDGIVYVSDFRNHHIQKFTPEGTFLSEFSTGSSFFPNSLCIDKDILYVVDWVHSTVCVYNTSGQFLGYIGNSDGSSFDFPNFIVSYQDRLYISDHNGVITYKCYQQ